MKFYKKSKSNHFAKIELFDEKFAASILFNSLDSKKKFFSFLYSLKPEEKNTTLGNKIRIKVINATKAYKVKEAYENDESVIGIHSWEDISIDYEVNIGTEANPKWFKIGSARNPYAYKIISKNPYSEKSLSPAHLYIDYTTTTDENEKDAIVKRFNELYSVSNNENNTNPIDRAKFESIGKAWLQQKKLYDAFNTVYKKEGKPDELIFSAESLKDIMSFDFTAGNFDFIKDPKNRKTLQQLESAGDVDNFKLVDPETNESVYMVYDLGKSKGTDLRQLNATVDDRSVSDQIFLQDKDKEAVKYGRYWLLVKDVKGKYRFVLIKPKKITDDYINDNFLIPIKDRINTYNKAVVGLTGPALDEAKSALQRDITDIYKKSIYLTLPTKPSQKTLIFLNVNFNKNTNEVDKRIVKGQGTNIFDLNFKIVPTVKTESPTPGMYVNIDVSDIIAFKDSLFKSSAKKIEDNTEVSSEYFTPITEDNIRMSFPQFDKIVGTKNKSRQKAIQEAISEVFEIPVHANIFSGNRLITSVSDNLNANTITGKLFKDDEDLSMLTDSERNLYLELKRNGNDLAAKIIKASKDFNFLTPKGGQITPGRTARKLTTKKLEVTEKEAKEAIALLKEAGYLYQPTTKLEYKITPDFTYDIVSEEAEDIKKEEEVEEEEEGDESSVGDPSFIDKLTYDDMLDLRQIRRNNSSFKAAMDDLASATNDNALLKVAREIIKAIYLSGEYTALINERRPNK
jgi:hypothetical protein